MEIRKKQKSIFENHQNMTTELVQKYKNALASCPHSFILTETTAQCVARTISRYYIENPETKDMELAICLSCFTVMPIEEMKVHYERSVINKVPDGRTHPLCLTTQSCVLFCVACGEGINTTPPTAPSVGSVVNAIRGALSPAGDKWIDPPRREEIIKQDLLVPRKLKPRKIPNTAQSSVRSSMIVREPSERELQRKIPTLATPQIKQTGSGTPRGGTPRLGPVSPPTSTPSVTVSAKTESSRPGTPLIEIPKDAKQATKQTAQESQRLIETSDAANALEKLRRMQESRRSQRPGTPSSSTMGSTAGSSVVGPPTGLALVKRVQQGCSVCMMKKKKEKPYTLLLHEDKTTVQIKSPSKGKVAFKFNRSDVSSLAQKDRAGLLITCKHKKYELFFSNNEERELWISFLGK